MDLHQLKVFREVARSGGFTRASSVLHLSQSTISLHIKRLEEELGMPLFRRSKRRVQLNKAGERLLPYVDRIFLEVQNASAAVHELSQTEAGILRLGSGATTVTYLLPKILGAFQRRYPQVELIVVTGSTEELLQKVDQQMLDMAVVMEPVKPSSSLETVFVLREELVYVVGSSHVLANRQIIDPKAIHDTPFISYLQGSAIRKMLDHQLSSVGAVPRVSMEMENIEAIKALVRAGLGAAILPLCCVSGSQGAMLHSLRVRGVRLERDLALVLPRSGAAAPIAQKLAGQIVKALSVRKTDQ
jgi:DNA-binding transcriptional LysR family regulator